MACAILSNPSNFIFKFLTCDIYNFSFQQFTANNNNKIQLIFVFVHQLGSTNQLNLIVGPPNFFFLSANTDGFTSSSVICNFLVALLDSVGYGILSACYGVWFSCLQFKAFACKVLKDDTRLQLSCFGMPLVLFQIMNYFK